MSLIPGSAGGVDREGLGRVRRWAQEVWALGDDDSVIVTELQCPEPGCPPLETVVLIAAAGRPTIQHKLHCAAGDVRLEDLQALARQETSA